jgi:hypothetical protein
MKNLKSVSIFSIPYFTFCSGLYHVAYWDTFNLNGLAYIGVSDLIKSFIYPFITFGLTIFIGIIYSEFAYGIDKVFPSGGGRQTSTGKKLNSKVGISIALTVWIVLVILSYRQMTTYTWFMFGFLISIVPAVLLDRLGLFENTFSNDTIRHHIIRLLIYIPAFSFAAGKYHSSLVQQNIKYKYTINQKVIPNSNSLTIDTLKLIGNTDKQYFFTDLKNSTTYILRSDIIDTLVLRQFGFK